MALNSSVINGAALNAGASTQAAREVVTAAAYRWRLRLMVGGVDWTARLTGSVEIDREEGAAGIARFDLCLPPGPLLPTDWKGRSVTIDYLSTDATGTTEARRYTGRIAEPAWDRTRRILSCTCSDQIQQQVEAMTVEQVDALAGGSWSVDLYEPVSGRSHWDYALERLASLPASLDASPDGALRVTSWFAQAPHFRFGPGATLYDSLSVELADLGEQTNQIQIEADYRFQRLWQHNQSFAWAHPGMEGISGIQGFCLWRVDSTELPTIEMIRGAVQQGGLTAINESYTLLPTTGVYCNPPQAWINNATDLVLDCSLSGARRWTQAVTEQYRFTVTAEQSVADVGPVVRRESASLAIETEAGEAWASDPIEGGVSGHADERDEARRVAVLETLLRQAEAALYAAHRGNVVSWDVPTSQAMGIDLVHTLEVNDQDCHAVGKCIRIVDSLDLSAGTAMTRLSIAVMRGGGGTVDPLTAPAVSGEPAALPSGGSNFLPTQLGGKFTSAPYDDEMFGFSGNYSAVQDATLEVFPRRFDVEAIEIPASYRDEHAVEIAATYRVAIPNDTLELT